MAKQRTTTIDRSADEVSDQTPAERQTDNGATAQDGLVPVKTAEQGRQELLVPPTTHRMIPARGTPLLNCPTNIDVSGPMGKAILFNATGEGSFSFGRDQTVEIDVKWYLVHWRTVVDPDTGEESHVPATVLIDKDGATCVTFSEVVPDRLDKLIQMYGPGPWQPPLRILVVQVKARRSGRVYHDIRLSLNQGQ